MENFTRRMNRRFRYAKRRLANFGQALKSFYEFSGVFYWALYTPCNLDCCYCIHRSSTEAACVPSSSGGGAVQDVLRYLDGLPHQVKVIFTGGEPLTDPGFTDTCLAIVKKHKITVTTNLVSSGVTRFAECVPPNRVVQVTATYHHHELERTGLTRQFFENYDLLQRKGFRMNPFCVAHPSLVEKVPAVKELFSRAGLSVSFGPFVGDYEGKVYPDSYTASELSLFGMSPRRVSMLYKRGCLCNAGDNVIQVGNDGLFRACLGYPEVVGDPETGYAPVGLRRCPNKLCLTLPMEYEKHLWWRAALKNPIGLLTALVSSRKNSGCGFS